CAALVSRSRMFTRLSSIRALASLLLSFGLSLAVASSASSQAQTPQKPGPAKKPPAAQTPVAPAAPISKHYPILLIASGSDPAWRTRIGMKGVERRERTNYPPIALDSGEIEQELAGSVWLYHAQDTAANAMVVLRLTRESCSDEKSGAKYSFRAVLN